MRSFFCFNVALPISRQQICSLEEEPPGRWESDQIGGSSITGPCTSPPSSSVFSPAGWISLACQCREAHSHMFPQVGCRRFSGVLMNSPGPRDSAQQGVEWRGLAGSLGGIPKSAGRIHRTSLIFLQRGRQRHTARRARLAKCKVLRESSVQGSLLCKSLEG